MHGGVKEIIREVKKHNYSLLRMKEICDNKNIRTSHKNFQTCINRLSGIIYSIDVTSVDVTSLNSDQNIEVKTKF